jgi:hypothetical protein
VSKLDDDKIYTSLHEIPENEEEEEKKEEDGLFEDDEEIDKRSYQSEEGIKDEEEKQLTQADFIKIEERRLAREQEKLKALDKEMKEKLNMHEFDIEIKKIDESQI